MAAQIIDGKTVADSIRANLGVRIAALDSAGVRPGLAVILVGEDPASASYVRSKERACERIGIYSRDIRLSAETSEEVLLDQVEAQNRDPSIHGILVQLPLPSHIDTESIINAVSPSKDVDGFHPVSLGRLAAGLETFVPCTPAGIVELLVHSGTVIAGSEAVVLGRSNIVGRPVATLLSQKSPRGNATVTICHSRTDDIAAHTRRADILVAAMGVPRFVTADMVKPGAVVIDVGVNRVDDPSRERGYRLVGDVDFEPVSAVAGAITPVPGGVGPMTIAMLLSNTVTSAERTLREDFR